MKFSIQETCGSRLNDGDSLTSGKLRQSGSALRSAGLLVKRGCFWEIRGGKFAAAGPREGGTRNRPVYSWNVTSETRDRSSGSYVPDNLCRPPSLFRVCLGKYYVQLPVHFKPTQPGKYESLLVIQSELKGSFAVQLVGEATRVRVCPVCMSIVQQFARNRSPSVYRTLARLTPPTRICQREGLPAERRPPCSVPTWGQPKECDTGRTGQPSLSLCFHNMEMAGICLL
ncbi:hypothetical protein Bbelb_311690 [Branchiostoma belcheri]|nr:hypothetical protein Bbelb_311690 [Branchiostoma belcheri]